MKFFKGIAISVIIAVLIWLGCTYIQQRQNNKGDFNLSDIISKQETTKGDFSNEQLAKASEVDSIQILVGAGEFIIKKSEDDYFHIDAKTDLKYKYGVENGKLFLESKNEKVSLDKHRNTVVIEIPENAKIKNAKLSFGACSCEIEELIVENNVQIEIGAGSLYVSKLVSDKVNASVGAGELNIYEMEVADADYDLGLGSIYLEGTVSNNLKLDCGMGSAVFNSQEEEKDHNYRLKCGMGSVDVFSYSIGGMSGTKNIDNSATGTYEIDCSMGSVEIY